ncbi:glycosyltransferase family 2 protein [Neotamlana nanhaiensis]|uniref:glycosyltransferase family 2 protein n=1 Tax=Neotamlana nanhaiensis TaxID=1382798 RepID=UPI000699B1CE|nr:glycosyltransferase family 2 protein [Tamlana nanhaiensis]
MEGDFKVSVIIPVYNCEQFIEKAIKSTLQQPEVAEVVVVNDGSSDNSLEVLKALQNEDKKVKIYHHKNKKNKGRATSRNLGIKKAESNYIAFLDADDFYLENRFKKDAVVFLKQKDADGVYNAVGFHFYRNVLENENFKLNTLSKKVNPNKLFDALITGRYGYFHINGLTVEKKVFERTGYFNDSLVVAEDTDMFWKMALCCKLYPGDIETALAKRGIHETNVFNNKKIYEKYELKLYESLYYWSAKQGLNIKIIERSLERMWILKLRQSKNEFKHFVYYLKINLKTPRLFFTYLGIKYFPLLRFLNKVLFL